MSNFVGFVKLDDKQKLINAVENYKQKSETVAEAFKEVKKLAMNTEIRFFFGLLKTSQWKEITNASWSISDITGCLTKIYPNKFPKEYAEFYSNDFYGNNGVYKDMSKFAKSSSTEIYLSPTQIDWIEKFK